MKKQDIIQEIGEAKYRAAVDSARKNDYTHIDELLMINDDVEITEDFLFDLFDLIWDKKILSHSEKLHLLFEVYEDLPMGSLVMSIKLNYKALDADAKSLLWGWIEEQILCVDCHSEPIEYYLGVSFFEHMHTAIDGWNALVRRNSPEKKILRTVLPISGILPYEKKKELYIRLLRTQNQSWHPYILLSLLYSFAWRDSVDIEDARRIFERLNISSGYEGEKKRLKEHLGII